MVLEEHSTRYMKTLNSTLQCIVLLNNIAHSTFLALISGIVNTNTGEHIEMIHIQWHEMDIRIASTLLLKTITSLFRCYT